MILAHINNLHAEEPTNWREIIKYSKLLVTAAQYQMPHGEHVALLDLHPWGECDENALVEDYISTASVRVKKAKNRRQCPINASVLFNKGGPEITGEVNMKIIAAYEKEKADVAAEKAEKKKARTNKKVQTREISTQEVVDMVIQLILSEQTPPVQFHDKDHLPISRKFKPTCQSCKAFMQVCMRVYLSVSLSACARKFNVCVSGNGDQLSRCPR